MDDPQASVSDYYSDYQVTRAFLDLGMIWGIPILGCLYIYIYIHTYIYTYIWPNADTMIYMECVYIYIYMYACMYVWMHVCMHVCMHACMYYLF